MANEDIRDQMRQLKVPYWKVAEVLGCSEGTIIRKMRYELSLRDRNEIEEAINKVISMADDDIKYDDYEELKKKQRDITNQIDELYYEIENLNKEHARICRALLHLQRSKTIAKIGQLNSIKNKGNHTIPLEKRKCEYCGKPVYAKDLCHTCYERLRRTGSAEPIQRKSQTKKHVPEPGHRTKEIFADKWAKTNSDLSIYEAYCKYGHCLLDRERKLIYYKLCKGYKDTEVAEIWSPKISRERVRQIYNKIIISLNKQIVKETAETQQQKESSDYFESYLKKDGLGERSINDDDIYSTARLTVRAFNAITRYGVRTVGDYYNLMASGEYKKVRNIGEKTAKVLIEGLESLLKSEEKVN